MRAALVMEDVLAGDPAATAALDSLAAAAIQPVVIGVRSTGDTGRQDTWPFRYIVGPPERMAPSGDGPDLLVEAARLAGAGLGEVFCVCRDAATAASGLDHGCRVMLVLGDRSLDDVFGDAEPAGKSLAVALDLPSAVRYALDEARESERSGPFPFAASKVDDRPAPLLPSPRELTKILALVVTAGVALALGIAYLLREAYLHFTFPSEAYYLTLQFIDRPWRGVLFLVVGSAAGLLAGYAVARLRYR